MPDPQKLVCIFAHPDDEAFGPGGAVFHFASQIPVYLICVTDGDFLHDKEKGKVRREELRKSAAILGVKKIFFLGFHDGELSLSNYHEIAEQIKTILKKIKPDCLMTFDINGVSGHPDHVVVSLISSFLFERLSFLKKIYYFCNNSQEKKLTEDYFIYFPEGYSKEDVDWVLDVKPYFKTKILAMKAHKSQNHDYVWLTTVFKKFLKEEYFKIRTKER